MQSSLLDKEKVVKATSKKEKVIPLSVISSKFIQKEKMQATTVDRFGNVISMEEAMKQSKAGQVGKGGKKIT